MNGLRLIAPFPSLKADAQPPGDVLAARALCIGAPQARIDDMPFYSYAHRFESPDCERYPEFEIDQPTRDLPLTVCPWCGTPVDRIMGAPTIKKRQFDCELRDKGFTKLVRVDDGIFENKTRRPGEEKYVDRRKPETFPKLEKTVRD